MNVFAHQKIKHSAPFSSCERKSERGLYVYPSLRTENIEKKVEKNRTNATNGVPEGGLVRREQKFGRLE